MKKGKNKAFTIIELIIVIAVIGVLTAVTIPVISGMIEKATFVDDVSLARNMTTSLNISGKDIDSVHAIEATIAETYGDDFVANLTPKTVDKGNHFWYNYRERKVEVKTLDEIASSEPYTRLDPSFRSCIKDGYALLDHSGSELAGMASLMEEVYTRRECDEILEYFGRESGLAANFVDNLNNTLIINENGCLRGANYNQISDIYFSSETVNLQKTVLFEFGSDAINFKTVSLDSPVAGTGLNGKTVEIKKTMFFGTHTLIFGEGCEVVLHADVNSLDDLKSIFGAASTNALIKINNDSHTYRIEGYNIVDAASNIAVLTGLTATISDAVLNVVMPAVETVNASQTVTTAGNVVSEATSISSGAVSATVPEGVAVTGSTLELQVTEKEASEANITLSNFATSAIDVHIEGVSPDNDVPIIVALGPVMPAGLKTSNVRLYHVEDYEPVLMTRVDSLADLTAHNTYVYDRDTGDVTIALKSFSEVLLSAGTSVKWDGTIDTSWYNPGKKSADYSIDTPEKLAGLAAIVNGTDKEHDQDSFEGKTVELTADIVINDWDLTEADIKVGMVHSKAQAYCALDFATSATNDPAFEQKDKAYKTWTPIGINSSNPFKGNFNGGGFSVSGLFGLYVVEPMRCDYLGLFGYIKGPTDGSHITISDFTVRDSWYYYYGAVIGLVTSHSYGNVNYKKINIQENFMSQYNRESGGVIGYLCPTSNVVLEDIVVDDTNIFEALWETYDAVVGGLIGYADLDYSKTRISFVNCQVYPVMNVFNDVCSNYQWHAYRRSGMLIGFVGSDYWEDMKRNAENCVSCKDVLVHFDRWSQYYYYKLPVEGNRPSYPQEHSWKYRRYQEDQLTRDSDGFATSFDDSVLPKKIGETVYSQTLTEEDFDNAYKPFEVLIAGGNYYDGFYQAKEFAGVSKSSFVTIVAADGTRTTTLVENGSYNLGTPVGYENSVYKWFDGENAYDVGETVTISKNVTFTLSQRIDFKPGAWDFDGALFGICAIDVISVSPQVENTQWFWMKENVGLGLYEAYIPVTHLDKIIFVRVNPGIKNTNKPLNWECGFIWNQTTDTENVGTTCRYSTFKINSFDDKKDDHQIARTEESARYLSLRPNDNWKQNNAKFAVYFFDGSNDTNAWRYMEYDSYNSVYRCEILPNYPEFKFVRLDPNGGLDWGSRWNEIDTNLEIVYWRGKIGTITGWSSVDG